MRLAAPLAFTIALSLVSACTADGPPDGRDIEPVDPADPADPPEEPPFAFFTDGQTVGAGIAMSLPYQSAFEPGDLRLVLADPSIADVGFALGEVRVLGLAPGRSWLSVESADGAAVLARLDLVVQEVHAVEIYVGRGPVSPRPLEQLARLAGSQASLHVVYRSADGYVLPGRGTFQMAGSAAAVLDHQAPLRRSPDGDRDGDHRDVDWCWSFPPGRPGETLDVYFDHAGQADLSVGWPMAGPRQSRSMW